MKTIYLILLLVGLSIAATAQAPTSAPITNEGHNLARFLSANNAQQLYTFSTNYTGVDGHPFNVEDLMYGTIETKEGEVFENVPFRYNVHEDVLEYNKRGEKINLFSNQLKRFSFVSERTGQMREFRNGFITGDEDLSQDAFFELIYDEGRSVVLGRLEKKVQRIAANPNAPGINSGSSINRFTDTKTTAYLILDGKFKEVKLKRKGFFQAFPGHEKKIKSYIRKNLLVCRSVEDLAVVTRYYDSMMERREAREEKED